MAEVSTGDSGGGHGKHEKKRAKKLSTRIDMTPMVDLAFLLLTFFVMTSTFNKAKTMEVLYPADPDPLDKPSIIKNAMTFILSGDDKIFYYDGELYLKGNKDGKPETALIKTDYSKDGLRKILFERNKNVQEAINKLSERLTKKEIADSTFKRLANLERGKKEAVTVLVKTDDKANFKNVVDVIDELRIAQIGKMAVIDISQPEMDLLKVAATQ